MFSSPITKPKLHRRGEKGYLLVGMLFMVALILIALAVAAPKMAVEIRRDKEDELIHRGNQYVRAIKLYYTKFGRYPISISQLENTNNMRFLRKKYKDPLTGKDDWRIIHLGEAKVPTMGLFGQPASSGATGTTGSTGTTTSTTGTGFSDSSAIGATGGSPSGGPFGSSPGSNSPFSSSSSASPSGSIFGSSGSTGSTDSNLGGGPIVGIGVPVKKASLREYRKQKHYNEWEFVYDPLAERLQGGVGGVGGNQSNTGGPQGPPTPTTPTSPFSQ